MLHVNGLYLLEIRRATLYVGDLKFSGIRLLERGRDDDRELA